MKQQHESTQAPEAAPATASAPASSRAGDRRALRGMSYADGAAALRPVQLKGSEEGPAEVAEPAPGDSVPADLDADRPAAALIPDDIKRRVLDQVRLAPRMVGVLDQIAQHGGPDFPLKWSRRGNYHSAGQIYLDRRRTITSWVPSMMHELSHLNDHRQGRRPSTTDTTREEFVRTKMSNEIGAHATAYVGLIEHENAEGAVTASPPAGYTEFRTHLRQVEAAERVCFAATRTEAEARRWLEDKYRNEWTTSNTGENYYDYWGGVWDDAHPDAAE